MQIIMLLIALLGTFVAALPTIAIPNDNGRGATIFKSPKLTGASTFIAGNNWCTNINNIFGNFDGKVRSLTVEPGYSCKFYVNVNCPANGKKMDIRGERKPDLSADFDTNIHSAICAKA